MNDPLTPAERVARSKAKKIAEGWRRMPTGLIPPSTVSALDALVSIGYAKTHRLAIIRAVEEMAGRLLKSKT